MVKFILPIEQYHPLSHFEEFSASPTQNSINVDFLIKVEFIKYTLNQLPVGVAVMFIFCVEFNAAFIEQVWSRF